MKNITISYNEYNSDKELPEADRELIAKAREIEAKAYSIYSKFSVGAAVLLSSGKVIVGNNQENIAYPSGMCAERVALFSAMAQFPEEDVITIAITASSKEFEVKHPISPCGACRQVISEYELKQKKEIRILLSATDGKVLEIPSSLSLLPFVFNEEGLKN